MLVDSEQLKQILLETTHKYEKEINLLHEQLRLIRSQMYGKKSKKRIPDNGTVQLALFDMPEPDIDEAGKEESVEVKVHSRKKPGRKKLPADLHRVEVFHDISDRERVCGCGATL